MSTLLQAIFNGDQRAVRRLLAGNPDLDIFEAAALGRADRPRELLAADRGLANAWTADGFQPLGLASFYGHPEAVDVLLEHDAEVNSPSRNDMKVMPLHSAAAARDPAARYAIAKALLEHGADPNAVQQDAFTPLMEADQNGDAALRELLVAYGATT